MWHVLPIIDFIFIHAVYSFLFDNHRLRTSTTIKPDAQKNRSYQSISETDLSTPNLSAKFTVKIMLTYSSLLELEITGQTEVSRYDICYQPQQNENIWGWYLTG